MWPVVFFRFDIFSSAFFHFFLNKHTYMQSESLFTQTVAGFLFYKTKSLEKNLQERIWVMTKHNACLNKQRKLGMTSKVIFTMSGAGK